MSHSLIGAGRATHLKIVAVGLAGAIAVVAIGITARVTDGDGAVAVSTVHKPGKPTAFTAHDATRVR
jgi:hypothetical protein